jgi:hypothetical protein
MVSRELSRKRKKEKERGGGERERGFCFKRE